MIDKTDAVLRPNVKFGICTADMTTGGTITEADDNFIEMSGCDAEKIKNHSLCCRDLMHDSSVADELLKHGTYFTSCYIGSAPVMCFLYMTDDRYARMIITYIGSVEDIKLKNDYVAEIYSYETALRMSEELLNCDLKQCSCILVKVRYADKIDARYGVSFTNTVLENAAIYLRHFYRRRSDKSILGRVNRDTVFILHANESPQTVESGMKWNIEELSRSYCGRDESFSVSAAAGIYHIPAGEKDIQKIIHRAGAALEAAYNSGDSVCVYSEDKHSAAHLPDNLYKPDNIGSPSWNLSYDTQFVAFSVRLLAGAKDFYSSIDIFLQRTGWRYDLTDIYLCSLSAGKDVKITNHWKNGKGVVIPKSDDANVITQGSLIGAFGSDSRLTIKNTDKHDLPESIRTLLKERGIVSSVSYLLYNQNEVIGCLSFCKNTAADKWNEYRLNTLAQLAKILSVFLSVHIQRDSDRMKINALSTDAMTGLHCLHSFHEEMHKVLKNFDPAKAYAIVYSDIDNFSYLNENFGYKEGDKVLCQFADTLEKYRTADAINCRIRADHFVSLAIDDTREKLAKKIEMLNISFQNMLAKKYPLSDLRISSGIYYITDPDCDLTYAIDCANRVRKSGKSDHYLPYMVYTNEFHKERLRRLSIIGSVHQAIQNGAIEAFLQPKFSMTTMTVIGAEALSRWRNPDGSIKFPNEYIPILEDVGYIVDIDFCIFEQSLQALAKWKRDGKKLLPISVNFSRVHIRYPNFVQRIVELTKQYDVDPSYVEIEITESCISQNEDLMIKYMNELQSNGFKIDIDDFGTGYSSLDMLMDVPADIIKLDKSFIDNYSTESRRAYINQIGNLVLSANKDIIFEGVETQAQVSFLTSYGYDRAQGFVFSRPIPMKEFEEKYVY